MNNNQYIVLKLDEDPINSFKIPSSELFASDSSDLSKAKGKLILTKRAVKEYIDRSLNNKNKIFEKFIFSVSDIVSCNSEKNNGIILSDKPNYFSVSSEGVVFNTSDKGIIVDNQNRVKQIIENPKLIENSKILNVLSQINVDYTGCRITDARCDGSENSKYLNTINFTGVSYEMDRRDGYYQYFLTNDGEIIYGKINLTFNCLEDIHRGNIVDANGNIIPMKILKNTDTLKMLNSIRVYFNVITNEILIYPNYKVYYVYSSDIGSGLENETYFSTRDKKWNVYKNSIWNTLTDYIYIGDIICESLNGRLNVLGFNHSDLKFILDDYSNIELKVDNDIIYTESDKTYLTVLNRFLEFDAGRIKWDLSSVINGVEFYLYIDGYGETFIDTMRPLYVNEINYYKHYYHYWRCVGKVIRQNEKWVVVSEKEM